MARLKSLPWHGASRASLGQLLARPVHAVLLHGAAGIGKLDLALDTAEERLCEASPGGPPCGQCAGCLLLAAANHPDLRIVRPEALAELEGRARATEEDGAASTAPAEAKSRSSREIRIEQIRELTDWITLSTHRGGERIIVIEPAEALNVPAANALLKMLEEPPPRTIFLLVSHHLDKIAPTLRSRCALLRIPLPGREMATRWLAEQGVERAAERLLEAGGAPLLAAQVERQGLPAELRDQLLGLLRRGGGLSAAAVVAAVPRDVSVGGAIALFQRWGWDFLSLNLAGIVRYHPNEVASLRQLASKWAPAEACNWIGELTAARAQADHPLNAKLAVEGMLLSYVRSINSAGHRVAGWGAGTQAVSTIAS